MKSNLPYNVMRNPNDWANAPRDPVTIAAAIAPSLFAGGAAIGLGGTLLTYAVSFAISAVTSWALSALAPKPTDSSRGLLTNLREATAPHEYVYGEVRKGGVITYLESTGEKNKYLHQIIALAGHEVESIGDIYIDDEIVTVEGETPIYTISVNQTVVQGGEGGETFTETATYTLTIPSAYDIYAVGEALSEAEFDVLVANAISNTNNSSFGNITFNSATLTSKVANVGLVTGDRWKSKIRVQKYLGGQTTAPADLLAESELTGDNALDANFVGNGIAYLYVRYEYDQDVFANGLPLVTAVVKGKKVYDPIDQTTGYSANAALCIRDYLTSEYGMYDVGSTNDTAFSVAAIVCDEDVDLAVTGVQPRYEMNGVISAASTPSDILQSMMTSCAGTLFWGQGKWQLRVGHYTPPVKTFTLDDLRGPINLSTRVSRRDNFNIVRGTFNNADDRFITQDYPQIKGDTFITEDNNLENVLDLALPLTTSSAMAQRIAKMTLFRGREQMTFSADFSMEAFNVQAGDIVALTNPRYGWVDKEFEVKDWKFFADDDAGDLRVSLTLQETSEAAFDWDAEETAIISNNTTLPDFNTVATVTNLELSDGSFFGADGTHINGISALWVASDDGFVDNYQVQWKLAPASNYETLYTTSSGTTIYPLVEESLYTVRVRAINTVGVSSDWVYSAFTTVKDQVAPAAPTNVGSTQGVNTVTVNWVNPTDTDFREVEVLRSVTNDINNASSVAYVSGTYYVDTPPNVDQTYYYFTRAIDRTGNISAPATVTTNSSRLIQSYDVDAGQIDLSKLSSDVTDTLADKVNIADYNITVDYQQQLEDATTQLATDALTLALNASSLESRINDAGITVDPATGSVTIQGLSAVEDQVNEVKIDLDAVEGELLLKATTTYVNSAIAAATLPEASLAELEALEARVGVVEVDLDSVEGSITLTSSGSYYNVNDSVLGVEALEGRITINEGQISLKASQTEMDDVETRLGSAEITLNSIDVPSISLAVQDVRSISEKQDDLAELTLQEVLGRYKDREYLLQDSAYARLSLTADVNDEREARATSEFELAAQIDENKALIKVEQEARATEDSAIAESVATLQADLFGDTGSITEINKVSLDSNSAVAQAVAQLNVALELEDGSYGVVESVSEVTEKAGVIESKYAVKVNTNGHVSGFGLISTDNGAVPTSEFIIAADAFKIGAPVGGNVTDSAFSVYTQDTVIGGVVYKAGTYVNGFLNAENINTGTLSADRIETGTITADLINLGDTSLASDGSGGLVVGTFDGDDKINGATISAGLLRLGNTTLGSNAQNELVVGAINGEGNIVNGTITANKLRLGNTTLASNANNELVVGAIDGTGNIINGTISAGKLKLDGVTLEDNGAGALKVKAIAAEQITSGVVSTSLLNIDGVTLSNVGGSLKVGVVDTGQLADLAITEDKIGDLQVDTVKIKDQAVSNTGADSGSATITTIDVVDGYTTIASVSLSTGGGQTVVSVAGQFSFGGVGQGSTYDGAWRILKGTTVLAAGNLTGVANTLVDFSGLALTTSAAGTTTITLQCTKTDIGGNNTVSASGTLVLTELKK